MSAERGDFDVNKVSGVFHRLDLFGNPSTRGRWEDVYKKKGPDVATSGPISEKHHMCLDTLRRLGFFNFPTENPQPNILQTGVGHGKTLQTILEAVGANVYGVDIAQRALNVAAERQIPVGTADMINLPFADGSFDGIFEVGVVEHFNTDDPFNGNEVDIPTILKALAEMRRVLVPGGKAAFIQPSRHSAGPLQKKLWDKFGRWDMGFQQDFAIVPFLQLLEVAGFNDRRVAVMQAPDDFPAFVRYGDRALMAYYDLTGQHRKAELTGALFTVVATNPLA